MTKTQAEALYALVNSPAWQAYVNYKRSKLDALHEQLEWEKDDGIKKIQGRVLEVRDDLTLQKKINDIFLRDN